MFLSILIPIHNTKETFLRQCLDSCLKQDININEYEIICVNNGSTTNVLSVLKDYEQKNKNLVVFSHENRGISGARNTGIRNAKGDYLWFVDSDDYLCKNILKYIKTIIRNNYTDRVDFKSFLFVDSSKKTHSQQDDFEIDKKGKYYYSSVWSHIYNRSFLLKNNVLFREKVWNGEDVLFNYEIEMKPHTAIMIDRVLYFYRVHSFSESHIRTPNKDSEYVVTRIECLKIVKDFFNNGAKQLLTIRFLHVELSQLMIRCSKLKFKEANYCLKQLLSNKLFPFLGFKDNKLKFRIYTNTYSFFLYFICRLSYFAPFFVIIKIWAKIWSSDLKKKFEKYIKRVVK